MGLGRRGFIVHMVWDFLQSPLSSLQWSFMASPIFRPAFTSVHRVDFRDNTIIFGRKPSLVGVSSWRGISQISYTTLISDVDKPWLTSHDCPRGSQNYYFFSVLRCNTMSETVTTRSLVDEHRTKNWQNAGFEQVESTEWDAELFLLKLQLIVLLLLLVGVLQCICWGSGAMLWKSFSPSTFTWVSGIHLRLPGSSVNLADPSCLSFPPTPHFFPPKIPWLLGIISLFGSERKVFWSRIDHLPGV